MTPASPFDGLQMPRELVCEFFAVFSRFEFTLKESRFVSVSRFGRATPDWNRFASKTGPKLVAQKGTKLDDAIAYLTSEPPQVQTAAQNWSQQPLTGSTLGEKAIAAAQRVRNNLFHGGKHTPHSPPGRDEKLVRLALVVLYACLEQDANLRQTFEQH